MQTPHFFFCFLAGGCDDSSSSGVFVSVVTLSDGFESISGVSAVGLEGGWGWVVGFDRIGFIRPAIASVTEPEVLSGVDSRAEFQSQTILKKNIKKSFFRVQMIDSYIWLLLSSHRTFLFWQLLF